MKTIIISLLLIPLTFFWFSLSHSATVDVSMVDTIFQPQNLNINAGDTVRWTNNGSLPHTSTSGVDGNSVDGLWNSGTMTPGATFSITFNQAGSFPYHCSFHWFSGMRGTITVIPASSTMPIPTGQQSFTYDPIFSPHLSNDPSLAKPVGVGQAAAGGDMLNIQIDLNQLSAAVDVYGAYSVSTDPGTINILNPDGVTFTPITLADVLNSLAAGMPPAGAQPWINNTTGPVSENLLETVIFNLPSDTYSVFLLVTPTGGLINYYLWSTFFIVPLTE